MSEMIEKNMKETAAASTLLVQVIVLVLMGMFLSTQYVPLSVVYFATIVSYEILSVYP